MREDGRVSEREKERRREKAVFDIKSVMKYFPFKKVTWQKLSFLTTYGRKESQRFRLCVGT